MNTTEALLAEVKEKFETSKIEGYLDALKESFELSISLEVTPNDNIAIGQSKVGGEPDLCSTVEWAKTEEDKSMSFIAQINCEEVAPYDKSELLPKKGLLSFFYCADQDAWGFDPKDKTRFKVIYSEHLDELERRAFPDDIDKEYSVFEPNKIEFKNFLSLPSWEDDRVNEIFKESETDSDNYFYLLDEAPEHQIFGHAHIIQGEMKLQCQLVTNGIYCGNAEGHDEAREKELEKDKDEWILLLQIGSEDEKTNMMWGDSGRVYFWIKKEDLRLKNFENVWCILQCY